MSPLHRNATSDAGKSPAGRARRATRGFQLPKVREIAPVAHGGSGADAGQHALDPR
jgi:hypothetical protein